MRMMIEMMGPIIATSADNGSKSWRLVCALCAVSTLQFTPGSHLLTMHMHTRVTVLGILNYMPHQGQKHTVHNEHAPWVTSNMDSN